MAPASVGINTFPNKKPKLFGGSTLAEGGNTETQQDNATGSGGSTTIKRTLGNIGATMLTFSNITTPANSILIIIVSTAPQLTAGTGNKSISLKRGATVLDTFNISTTNSNSVVEVEKIFVDTNPEPGTNTYTLEENDGLSFGGVTATLMFIVLTDAHTVKNIHIING